MNVFLQALLLMLYGLGAVFFTLILFLGMITLLTTLFKPKPEAD